MVLGWSLEVVLARGSAMVLPGSCSVFHLASRCQRYTQLTVYAVYGHLKSLKTAETGPFYIACLELSDLKLTLLSCAFLFTHILGLGLHNVFVSVVSDPFLGTF